MDEFSGPGKSPGYERFINPVWFCEIVKSLRNGKSKLEDNFVALAKKFRVKLPRDFDVNLYLKMGEIF